MHPLRASGSPFGSPAAHHKVETWQPPRLDAATCSTSPSNPHKQRIKTPAADEMK
jgi:hypothetical protein